MKNINIFPQEWMSLHPYPQSTPVDLYYTDIANRIYDILEETGLIHSFEKDEAKQICIRMAAYFEDVISGLNIWRSFILEHKALFGKYLPFYTPDDYYYDDEINYEDIRFLLWHYTQQYHGARRGSFVSPDNIANIDTASRIYELFSDRWTTAPENEKMKQLFAPESRYDQIIPFMNLLHWFHYNCYLFPKPMEQLTDTIKGYWEETRKPDNEDIFRIYDILALFEKSSFLAYTSLKWLSLIIPADHPDHEIFVTEGEKKQAFRDLNTEEEKSLLTKQYQAFTDAAEGKPLLYFQSRQETEAFLQTIGVTPKEIGDIRFKKLALYATPREGIQILTDGIEYIKDENNPFYNQEKAQSQALSFFMVKQCQPHLLRIMEENGMLADAQAKSLSDPERGKAIIHENWEFLMRYFIREID